MLLAKHMCCLFLYPTNGENARLGLQGYFVFRLFNRLSLAVGVIFSTRSILGKKHLYGIGFVVVIIAPTRDPLQQVRLY